MNDSDYHHILFDRRDHGILWLTLNRPEALNAADARMHTEPVSYTHLTLPTNREV